MNISDQVTSLELSKALKEMKVPQESFFYWIVWPNGNSNIESGRPSYMPILEKDYGGKPSFCSAFTVAELGEIMKEKGMGTTAFAKLVRKEWWVRGGEWIVEKQQYSHIETDPKWADALGKMLLYLLTQQEIKT